MESWLNISQKREASKHWSVEKLMQNMETLALLMTATVGRAVGAAVGAREAS